MNVKILTSLLKNICAIFHLVDLDTQAAARSEVVRLGQVAQAVVVHGILQITEYLLTWHPANIIEYYCKILSTSAV